MPGLPFGWLGHYGGIATGRVEVRARFLDAEAGGGELVRVHDRGPPAGRYIYTAPAFTIAGPLQPPWLGLQTQVDPSS